MRRSLGREILEPLIGLIVLLLFLSIANFFVPKTGNLLFLDILYFFNVNLTFLISLTFVTLINSILWHFSFPFNILAPISGSVLGALIVILIYNIWLIILNFFNVILYVPIDAITIFGTTALLGQDLKAK